MTNAHIDDRLDRDWKIFRPMSFHGLMDLLTFGQLGFAWAHPLWRDGLLGAVRDRTGPHTRKPSPARPPGRGAIALQSWTLLPAGGLQDWHERDMSRPHVCVVSNIGAMARAFLTASAVVRIEGPAGTRGQAAVPGAAAGARHVHVIVNGVSESAPLHGGCLRLHADLSTLVQHVVVSSRASDRFVELVAKQVQANTPATVSRARHVCEDAAEPDETQPWRAGEAGAPDRAWVRQLADIM